ncbi:MAG: general stress protein [Chloroflexi bacterium]|nr:general stress protein [Chloroflexota bacterium]
MASSLVDIVADVAITRLFASSQAAREAIVALQASGVDPRAVSVVTRLPRDAATLQTATGANDDLEDAALHRGRLAQFVDWLGKVESATVPSFGAILGTGNLWQDVQLAGSGRGSITGALVGCGVPVDEAAQLEQAVFDGQVLVVVHGAYDQATVSRVLRPT